MFKTVQSDSKEWVKKKKKAESKNIKEAGIRETQERDWEGAGREMGRKLRSKCMMKLRKREWWRVPVGNSVYFPNQILYFLSSKVSYVNQSLLF